MREVQSSVLNTWSRGWARGSQQRLPSEVRKWMLSLPSQNSVSWLPKPRLYDSQSRKKFTDPSQRLWKTCGKGDPQPHPPPNTSPAPGWHSPPTSKKRCPCMWMILWAPGDGTPGESLVHDLHLPWKRRRKWFLMEAGSGAAWQLPETPPWRSPPISGDSPRLLILHCPLNVCFPLFLFLFWCHPSQP